MLPIRLREDGDLIIALASKSRFPVYKQYAQVSRRNIYPDMDFKIY